LVKSSDDGDDDDDDDDSGNDNDGDAEMFSSAHVHNRRILFWRSLTLERRFIERIHVRL